jgi:dipeptidyl aminopeptidase/acylaminoacyl peptidase
VNSDPTVLSAADQAKDAAVVPKVMQFLGAYSNTSAVLTKSGRVVFVSTRDGLPQLYVADAAHPKSPARRLPTPKEQVRAPALTSDEKTVLFLSDVKNDENFHVFAVPLDGAENSSATFVDLTPGETLHRNAPAVARDKPDLFAYSAHAPASERTRLFVQSRAGGAPREFYADERGGFLADLSPDGTHALFVRENADDDAIVFDVDVANGKTKRIFPEEGKKARAWATYSAKADRVFVSTQSEGKPSELLSFDRTSGKQTARYEDALSKTGLIDDVAVTPSGDAIALGIDCGNHTELRVLDARTLALVKNVQLPLGLASLGTPTRDGKRVTLSVSRADAPFDVFSLDVKTGALTPLRDDERPGLADLPPLTTTIESVRAHDGLMIPVNTYRVANGEHSTRKSPVIVWVHGGPTGSAKVRYNADARFYTSLGYAIVEPNIRGSSGFGVAYESADNKGKRGDALRDVEAVRAWALEQPWADGRAVIMGGSYGGYMTLLALARGPKLWSAGIDVSGMSDLRTMERLEDQSIRVYDETEFGVLGKEDDLLYEWSPLKYVDNMVAPLFVYQGKNDPVTPQNEADQIVKALRKRRVPVEYMLLADEGHGILRRENKALFLARASRFLESQLAR